MLAFKNGITHAFILGNARCSHKHSVNDNCIHDDNHFFSCHFAFMHEIITNSNKTHILNLNRKWKCPLFALFLIYQCAIFVFPIPIPNAHKILVIIVNFHRFHNSFTISLCDEEHIFYEYFMLQQFEMTFNFQCFLLLKFTWMITLCKRQITF